MTKYFDKDFFKFFLGFFAIISVSLIIIMATRAYQVKADMQKANVIDSVSTKVQNK